jgi:hypothetical protein
MLDGAGEFVFGEAAAGGHEGAERTGKSVMLLGIGAERCRGFGTDDPQRQRIVEDFGVVEKLMRGPANRYSLCGSAEFAFLHDQGWVWQ